MLNKELEQASVGSDSKIQGRPEDQMTLQWFKCYVSGLNQKLMQNHMHSQNCIIRQR